MPNPSETRTDAVTELVRILREQLASKDERIRALESQLSDANDRIADQQRLLARLLERTAAGLPDIDIAHSLADAHVADASHGFECAEAIRENLRRAKARRPPVHSDVLAAQAPAAGLSSAPVKREADSSPIRISDLGMGKVQIGQIASAVLSAKPGADARVTSAPARAPAAHGADAAPSAAAVSIGESERTWRFEREELRRGHRALKAKGRRGFWPFGRAKR